MMWYQKKMTKKIVPFLSDYDLARLAVGVDFSESCWLWSGTVSARGGYPLFSLNRELFKAHRVTYQEASQEQLDPALNVLHSCETNHCVRPDHCFESYSLKKKGVYEAGVTKLQAENLRNRMSGLVAKLESGFWNFDPDGSKKKERLRWYAIKYKYGLDKFQYETLIESQGGRCAMCKQEPKPGHSLHVDHDHTTGKVRGALCGRCNSGIGFLDKQDGWLPLAIDYLKVTR